ncbi:hypothetical protein [Pseudomonas sp. LB3P38]|uniref:hypothetical protein n=1 Tax=Pseudomonas lyxosi TaxID=3398358 RepID=UPI0039F0299D
MHKLFGKGVSWWCKAILKYGLVLALCYWVVDFYIEWERMAEAREHHREVSKKCSQKLADMEQVPILGGSLLDRTRIPGFHFGSSTRDGLCIADVLEGSFWWTGTELRTEYQESGKEKPSSWGHFNVAARLYTRKPSTEPYNMGLKVVDWPEELIVKLKNYPGLELWLTAPPASSKNNFSVTRFVMRDWRRRDGTPRTISCDGLDSPWKETLESGVSGADLLRFNKSQLENLDFGGLDAYCTVGLHNFDFAGGDARVGTGTGSLRGAPMALQMISEYLSNSIITGK